LRPNRGAPLNPVVGFFLTAAEVPGNRGRVDQFTPQGIQTRESTRLINAHEARVADHVGRQDRRKPPLKALLSHVDRSPKLQVPISSHRKLLWSKAMVVSIAGKPEQSSGRQD
jgi:hypothetical protein